MEKLPWYLRKGFVLTLCIITPPIGYLYVYLNRNKWEKEEMITYLASATITSILWVMKFVPSQLYLYTILPVILVALFLYGNKD